MSHKAKVPAVTFTPPPYVAGPNKFYGTPDEHACVLSDENKAARRAIIAFGQTGSHERAFANFFLKSMQSKDQVADVGDFFSLDDAQAKSANLGTLPAHFINVAGGSWMPASDATGQPAADGGAAWPGPNLQGVGGVTFANEGSLYAAICATFQHNINVGADGSIGGFGGADIGL